MLWLVLITIASFFIPVLPLGQYGMIIAVAIGLLALVTHFLMVVGVVLLLAAQGNHFLMIIVCGILMLVPQVNLLLLLFVNMSITRTLRRAGLHVGLMGAKDEEVERIVNPELCTGCGYNLTGNVSGYCTECGRTIESQERSPVSDSPDALAG